jgi:hypothetical protein
MAERLERCSFESHKKAWKQEGRFVCRHGVFFDTSDTSSCPCLTPRREADWSLARLMPSIDEELKAITVDTFDAFTFQRLGCVQAELRRRGW